MLIMSCTQEYLVAGGVLATMLALAIIASSRGRARVSL
jgi:hypothetical protein